MTVTRAQLIKNVISVVWLGLIGLTLLSWWLGTDHGIHDARFASVVVLLVAFAKVRLVGLDFMELRHAPLPLRLLLEGWCAIVCTAVVAMYLVGA
jgi:hypothetical protein